MAVTNEQSQQLTDTDNGAKLTQYGHGARFEAIPFQFTQGAAAGDAGSTENLAKLPAGRIIVAMRSSFYHIDALGASRTLDIGHRAYTAIGGAAVVEDEDLFDDGVDVSSVVDAAPGSLAAFAATGGFWTVQSEGGIILFATTKGGTIPAASKLFGYFMVGTF